MQVTPNKGLFFMIGLLIILMSDGMHAKDQNEPSSTDSVAELEIKALKNKIKELQEKKKRETDYHKEYLKEKQLLVQEIQNQKLNLNLEISDMRKGIVSISNQIKSIELFMLEH